MKINRILLGFSLVATLLSAMAYPSLGIKNPPASAKTQDEQLVTGQLIQGQTRDGELSKHFRKYDLIRMDPHAIAKQVRDRGRLRFKSSVREFDMHLTPHNLLSPDYSATMTDGNGRVHKLPKPEVTTYKGEVKGLPDAQVRISVTDRGVEGAIISREKRYFLQPAAALSKAARADEFVFYDDADLQKEEGTCSVTLADQVATQEASTKGSTKTLIEPEVANALVTRLGQLEVVLISTDTDGEFTTALGGATQANEHIRDILNIVDGIYQFEIGITFLIVDQHNFADAATDPYTTAVSGDLLEQFRVHWEANFPSTGEDERTIAHLFTGKDLDGPQGPAIGIAFTSQACRNPTHAYGLSQRFPTTPGSPITAQTVILTAHEIGHNFGAAHTNEADEFIPFDPERSCQNTIMEAFIGDGSSFCPFSRSQIIGHANANISCLVDSTELPPTHPSCSITPITPGVTANGNLSTGDCRSDLRGVEHFADRYTFNGTAGQRISISMSSEAIDTYVYLVAPDGYVLTQDDDSGADTNSRIPTSGTITLPQTGVYTIETTSFDAAETGAYSLTVAVASCSISVSPGSLHFPQGGGSSAINVTLTGSGCDSYRIFVNPSTATWVTPEPTDATGSRSINFTVSANNNSAGRRAFIMVGAGTGAPLQNNTEIDPAGGLRIPLTQSGTSPNCVATPIAFGQTLNGTLSDTDCHSPVRGNNFFADRYTFNALAGQKIRVRATAPSVATDTYLVLIGPNGVVLYVDDDGGGTPSVVTNSQIPGGTGLLPLGLSGTYTIEVTEFSPNTPGTYSINLTGETPVNTIQLPSAAINIGEAGNFLGVNVTRSGDTSGAATVNFSTSDTAGLQNCTIANNRASERCDYATVFQTLRFEPNETSKLVIIPIVNDVIDDENETFTIRLTSPNGATLGTSQATVTINDNDGAATQNPIDGVDFFVNQQYIDFLGRLPDSTGFANWVATLGGCPNGGFGENLNPTCDRVHVSSGFFLSIEFQGRGYFAYRFYEVALNRPPVYAEFVPDMAQVGGAQSPASEVLSKATYTQEWTQRPAFKSRYDALTNQAYVDALEANAEVTLTNKMELVMDLNGGVKNRGEVLRNIVENAAVENRFFIRAFVSMQYFGYLRRDPDAIGFQNWVDTLNANPSNSRHMIFGFLFSTEYRQRFGP